MAKHIQFPLVINTETGETVPQIYNSDTITLVTNPGVSNLDIYCGLIRYSYKVNNNDSTKLVDAINKAILAVPGPILTNVIIPEDLFLTDFSVTNISAV